MIPRQTVSPSSRLSNSAPSSVSKTKSHLRAVKTGTGWADSQELEFAMSVGVDYPAEPETKRPARDVASMMRFLRSSKSV